MRRIVLILLLSVAGCSDSSTRTPKPVANVTSPDGVPKMRAPADTRGQLSAEWEAKLPKGGETNLIELNRAKGDALAIRYIQDEMQIDARWEQELLKRMQKTNAAATLADVKRPERYQARLKPFTPRDLRIKATDLDGLFEAEAYRLPPDMLGAGSFYLIKNKDDYYMLTRANYARLFGPVTNKAKVLPYVSFYYRLFESSFGSVVTNKAFAKNSSIKPPPEITTIKATKDGFAVKLIVFNNVHQMYYGKMQLLVHTNGTVTVIKEFEIIKDLGPGIMF